jgi:hypothetical protein
MAVFFQCKSCEGEHRSPAGFADQRSFDASPMLELRFVCRVTGATTGYRKTDMYWRSDLRERDDARLTMLGCRLPSTNTLELLSAERLPTPPGGAPLLRSHVYKTARWSTRKSFVVVAFILIIIALLLAGCVSSGQEAITASYAA